jgi:gliding motility-associated-like protein
MQQRSPLFVALFLAGCLPSVLRAQVITIAPDTTLCAPDNLTLYALVDGSYNTDNYTWELIPHAPEPLGLGAVVTLPDDDIAGPFPIGFEFCFMGNVYTQFWLASNGWISFTPPTDAMGNDWSPEPIPSGGASIPKNAVMGPWEDWHTGICSGPCMLWYSTGVEPNRKLVVSFENLPMFSCTGEIGNFQIVLEERTNIIVNHLIDKPNCPTWASGLGVQGLHDATGALAYSSPGRNATMWTASNESGRWLPDQVHWYDLAGTLLGVGDSLNVFVGSSTSFIAEIRLCDGSLHRDTLAIDLVYPFEAELLHTDISCFGANDGSAEVLITGATPPVSYTWSTGDDTPAISDLGPGVYTIEVQDATTCLYIDSVQIDEPPLLELNLVEILDASCFAFRDGRIRVLASGGVPDYQYTIDGVDFVSNGVIGGLPAGTYTVLVQDLNGCETSLELTVGQPDAVVVEAGPDLYIAVGSSAELSLSSSISPSSIFWVPAESLSCADCPEPLASPQETTVYTVTIGDASGCLAIDTQIVYVFPPDLGLPNAFSPNGDGINDVFAVLFTTFESFELSIYNRWGEQVFFTQDAAQGWDGTWRGKLQQVGVYLYTVRGLDGDGRAYSKQGSLTLVR